MSCSEEYKRELLDMGLSFVCIDSMDEFNYPAIVHSYSYG